MTRESDDRPLDLLERRFKALRDQLAALPEAARPGLETAIQEVSRAIDALRAAGGCPPAEAPACPEAADAPASADTILRHVFSAIPDMLTVIDQDFHIIMSNWHDSGMVPAEARRGRPKCYRVFHHRDRPCKNCHVQKVFDSGQPQKTEKINLLDGRTREFGAFPIQSESGQVILAAEHVRDVTERRRAEQALSESEKRFRTLIEDSPESLFLTDVQGTVLAASRVAARRLGKELEDLIGINLHAMLPPEVGKKRFEIMQQVVATGQPARFEDVRGNFYFDNHINPILGADGKVSRLSILGIDITDRKKAEEALRESEARFRMLFEHAPDAFFIMDLQGNFLDLNRRSEEMGGYERQELIGKNFQSMPMLGDRQNQMMAELLQQAKPGEIIGPVKYTLTRKDGGQEILEAKCLPFHEKGENLLLVIARDITARQRAEEALRESEATLRTLIEANPETLVLFDTRGVVLAASRVAAQRLGRSLEEIIGIDLHAMLPPEVGKKRFEIMQQVVATGQPARFEDVRGDLCFDNSVTPIFDQDQVVQIAVLGVDITSRKKAEQALKESEARLRGIFATAQDAVFIKDGSFRYAQINPAMERLFGRPAAEIIGKTDLDLSGAADTGRIRKEDRRVLNGEVVKGVHAVPVQGVPITFHYIKAPLLDDAGKIVGICGIARDITDMKQAQAALEESEERFRMLFDHVPDAYILTDMQGEIIDCNQAAEELAGYGREELVGNNFACLPWLDFRQQIRLADLLAQTARGEVMGPVDFTLTRKDGGEVIAEGMSLPLSIQGQNLVLTIVRDITARKQAEAGLRASEELFRSLVEHINLGITLIGSDYRIIMTNPAQGKLFHKHPREFIGKECFREFEKRQTICPHCPGAIAMATGQGEQVETEGIRDDGSSLVGRIHAFPSFGPDGGINGFIEVVEDITQSKQVEKALRESEQRFRLMAETIQDVFWIATAHIGKTAYVSPGFEIIWGRTCEALYRHPKLFLETVHPDDRERVKMEIIAARERGVPWDHEYRIVRPDGTVRWILNRGFPVRDDQGRVILFTGVATDITEHKALEGQLLQAQKMEAVGRLAGGVAHDFNNLLMAITGYGELMRAKVLKDDPLYGYLENILKAGDRAVALTQQLLTFSRQKIVHPQVIDLNRVVLDLEPMLRRLIGEDLDLEVVTDRRPGVVKADPGQMGQIIMNLVVNARDAMPQGGRLTLKTAPVNFTVGCHNRFGLTPPGAYVTLVVQDTGVGMDEATQAHVFEPFFTTKEPGKGTGLGLSTVYGFVKQSDGYLDLESSAGDGSTFTIYLPRLEAVAVPPRAKIPITASFRGEETILLVEDEDVLRGLLAKFLRLCGYTVLEARHGGEALLTCERHPGPIHVMVTDVVMPQMSGRELADRLTPLRPEMHVLYMSGYTGDALVQHGVADWSVAFLQKPFRPIELARRVHTVLHPPLAQ
jgi:two-component system, cell cycle sensor histidine kinase and response regulator CckA